MFRPLGQCPPLLHNMSRCPAVTDLASGRDTLHIYIPHTERGRNAGWLSSPTTACSKLLLKLLHLSSFLPLCVTSLRSSSPPISLTSSSSSCLTPSLSRSLQPWQSCFMSRRRCSPCPRAARPTPSKILFLDCVCGVAAVAAVLEVYHSGSWEFKNRFFEHFFKRVVN